MAIDEIITPEEEFIKWFLKTMNTDSGAYLGATTRSMSDTEATKFAGHVWNYINERYIEINPMTLFYALMNTRKYESMQDKAEAMVKYLKRK